MSFEKIKKQLKNPNVISFLIGILVVSTGSYIYLSANRDKYGPLPFNLPSFSQLTQVMTGNSSFSTSNSSSLIETSSSALQSSFGVIFSSSSSSLLSISQSESPSSSSNKPSLANVASLPELVPVLSSQTDDEPKSVVQTSENPSEKPKFTTVTNPLMSVGNLVSCRDAQFKAKTIDCFYDVSNPASIQEYLSKNSIYTSLGNGVGINSQNCQLSNAQLQCLGIPKSVSLNQDIQVGLIFDEKSRSRTVLKGTTKFE